MCLQVFAIPAIEGRVSAKRLSAASGLHIQKLNKPYKGAFWFSRDGGCSCSLMADDADWEKPVWALEPEVLEPLAKALQFLGEEAGDFTFQATWSGDTSETSSNVTLEEILIEARTNQIKNKHLYNVNLMQPESQEITR